MSTDELPDGDLGEIGGDCSPFVMLCSCIRAYADTRGLKGPQRHALLELILAAGYRTGIVGSVTWDCVAALLSCSVPTAKERLGTLEAVGAIRYWFPRGHPGFVAVVCYLDVVRVKAPLAAPIARALANAEVKADDAAERAALQTSAATKASNGADLSDPAPVNEEFLRTDRGIFRSDAPHSFPKQLSERPGRRADLRSEDAASPSSASKEAVGGRSRRTTVSDEREATRLSRMREYDQRLFGEQP